MFIVNSKKGRQLTLCCYATCCQYVWNYYYFLKNFSRARGHPYSRTRTWGVFWWWGRARAEQSTEETTWEEESQEGHHLFLDQDSLRRPCLTTRVRGGNWNVRIDAIEWAMRVFCVCSCHGLALIIVLHCSLFASDDEDDKVYKLIRDLLQFSRVRPRSSSSSHSSSSVSQVHEMM